VTPSARSGGALVYDSSSQQVVLFGGVGDQVYGDTWAWDGTCWRQLGLANPPPPRFAPAYAFDPRKGVVFLYGGRQAPASSDFYDGWTWNGQSWVQLPATYAPELIAPVAAFDPLTGKVVVFGMTSDQKSVQTWTWDGGWQHLEPASSPSIRVSTSMAYDANSGRIILFGGRDAGSLAYLGDTWSWDGSNWTELRPSTAPSARQNPALVGVPNGVLLFGGDAPGIQNTDTWTWNGATWRQIVTPHAPPANATAISESGDGVLALVAYFTVLDWRWLLGAVVLLAN